VPEQANEEHLEILSELAELLSDSTLRTSLMEMHDASQVHQLLDSWQPYRPAA
jgi:PTS system nitrogen regulatory IIA component